jgi:hypothetical protein
MTAPRPWVAENTTQRDRLRALVKRLSDADLRTPLAAGWTVAGVLGHLAFWDQRALVLLQAWEKGTTPPAIDARDVDWVNDAGKALCLALGPRAAADLAVSTAEAVDRAIEALDDERVAANRTAGNPLNLLRAEHRREHLDEIERALRG